MFGLDNRTKGIIFDLDGTLLDSMGLWKNLGSDYLKKLKENEYPDIEIPEDFEMRLKTLTLKEAAILVKDMYHINKSVDNILEDIKEMVADQYKYDVQLMPFAKELLDEQRMLGTKMCILTASEKSYVLEALKRLEVLDYFEFVITCTELDMNKNTPDSYIRTAQMLGLSVDEVTVFEDAKHAIETAKAGGFRVVEIK